MMNFNECPFYSALLISTRRMLHRRADGATIKSISENIVVNPGDEAKLSCAVDGKFARKTFFFLSSYSPLLCFDSFCFCAIFHGINYCNGSVFRDP